MNLERASQSNDSVPSLQCWSEEVSEMECTQSLPQLNQENGNDHAGFGCECRTVLCETRSDGVFESPSAASQLVTR
jgi:hypothetical protein